MSIRDNEKITRHENRDDTRENEDQFQQSETEKTGNQNDSGRKLKKGWNISFRFTLIAY